MIVFDHFKVKLAPDKIDMRLQLLFEDFIFQFGPKHHGVHLSQAEFCVGCRGKELLAFVVLLRLFRSDVDLCFTFI